MTRQETMRKRQEAVNVLPINLIVGDRLFVVVGGGKVALRKTRLLLGAGARVRVVSPELCDELRELAEDDRISVTERSFEAEDVTGAFLAFAATDDHEANLRVLEASRRAGVLCCPVDHAWPEGDFLTPATFRESGLVVSVSTGGQSCRRARLVRENLQRHIDLVGSSDLLVMGTSHEHLPVGEREDLHLSAERFERTGQMLSRIWGVHEFVLLSTCNRVEFIATVAENAGVEPLLERVLGFEELRDDQYYRREGFAAFRHLALVTSGMLSQSPGEDHIVAQVKEALEQCAQRGWADGMMRGWIGAALHLSRDIREATAELLQPGEIEDICLQYLLSQEALAAAPVVVIGSGVVGRSLARRLVEAGCRLTWCYHETPPALPDAWADRVSVAPLDGVAAALGPARAVFTAVSSERHVLSARHLRALSDGGGAVVFDLGIPRNVAPDLRDAAENVRILDLDDLKQLYSRELADLSAALETADEVIEEHRDIYERAIDSLQDRNAEQ